MPPAGRPRKPQNRDLPPGMIRRVYVCKDGSKSVRYMFQAYGGKQTPLGTDLQTALAKWHELITSPGPLAESAFSNVVKSFLEHGLHGKADKTKHEYKLGCERLKRVFGDAPLETIRPVHVGKLMAALRDTPFMANRLKSLLSLVFNHGRDMGMTDAPNPCLGRKGFSETPRRVIVAADVFWAYHDAAPQRFKDWMILDRLIGDRVTDVTRLKRADIVADEGIKKLRRLSTKTGARGSIKVEGDLLAALDEMLERPRKVSGLHILANDDGSHVTYGQLKYDMKITRAAVAEKHPDLPRWQMRDMRKTSLNDSGSLEEARRRGMHTDARTTARHYETDIEAEPARLPRREK